MCMFVCLTSRSMVLGIISYFCLVAITRGLHALFAFCGCGGGIAAAKESRFSQNIPDVSHIVFIFLLPRFGCCSFVFTYVFAQRKYKFCHTECRENCALSETINLCVFPFSEITFM